MGSGRDKRKKAAKRVGKDGSGPSGDAKTSAKTDKNAAKLERRMAKAAAEAADATREHVLAALCEADKETEEEQE